MCLLGIMTFDPLFGLHLSAFLYPFKVYSKARIQINVCSQPWAKNYASQNAPLFKGVGQSVLLYSTPAHPVTTTKIFCLTVG